MGKNTGIRELIAEWAEKLAGTWQAMSPVARVGVGAYAVAFFLIIGFFIFHHAPRQAVVAVVQPKEVVVAAPAVALVPQKIVIDSVDKAALADAFDDDNTT